MSNTFTWSLIVLDYWNNTPHVNISLQFDMLSWLRANQSFLILLHVLGREAVNTNVIVLDLIQMGLESHANHYTNNADLWSQLTTDMFLCRYHNPILSSFLIIKGCIARVTRRISLVGQELLPFRKTWVHARC